MVIRPASRVARGALGALLACLVLLVSGCSTGGGDKGGSSSTTATASATASASATARAEKRAKVPEWARGMATIRADQLPEQAQQTLRAIDAGGPFPYAKDGTVFGNYEKALPKQKRGYYHEYTVRTPGSKNRGARRIVTGDGRETFYTEDHYRTFKAVLR